MDNLTGRRPIWIRLIALFFLVFSVLVLGSSIGEIAEALTSPKQSLSLYPRDMPPSSNIVMRNVHRIRFAVAVYNGLLAPVFIVNGSPAKRPSGSAPVCLPKLFAATMIP